jgi:hypothetical protein
MHPALPVRVPGPLYKGCITADGKSPVILSPTETDPAGFAKIFGSGNGANARQDSPDKSLFS